MHLASLFALLSLFVIIKNFLLVVIALSRYSCYELRPSLVKVPLLPFQFYDYIELRVYKFLYFAFSKKTLKNYLEAVVVVMIVSVFKTLPLLILSHLLVLTL